MAAPVPMGPHRARRIDPELKKAIGEQVGQGDMGKTGGMLARSLARARRWPMKKISEKVANNAIGIRVAAYAQEARVVFAPENVSIVSMALDGTRMGGRDTLYSVLYSPERNVAAWAPPQAPRTDTSTTRKSMCICDLCR
mgnify:CR=1 FL=1